MVSFVDYFRRIRQYRVLTAKSALAAIETEIEAVANQHHRQEARQKLADLRRKLDALDLTDCGWPPQATNPDEDVLHADSQLLVSAILRIVHSRREVRIIKFVLKGRAS